MSESRSLDHAVLQAVGFCVGLRPAVIRGRGRTKTVARARQLAMFILHTRGLSFIEVARAVGRKDHTTALAAVRAIRRRRRDPDLESQITGVQAWLAARGWNGPP